MAAILGSWQVDQHVKNQQLPYKSHVNLLKILVKTTSDLQSYL